MTFSNGKISAIASVVGSDRHTLGESSSCKGSDSRNLAKLKELMGLDEGDVASQSTTTGDLRCEAAEQLFSARVSKREEIEAVIMVTQTPDYIMPAPAAVIHGKLGLRTECAAF